MRHFLRRVAAEYANSCDGVIAPSESIADMIRENGVSTPIRVVPTGVDTDTYAQGDGSRARATCGVPEEAFAVGHVGRLAPEKNLHFLSQAAALFLKHSPQSYFLIAGSGRSEPEMKRLFEEEDVSNRVRFAGVLKGRDLIDAYHAMDVFVFASKTETQGMVLAEAAAAGVPIVAVDAPGAREVVRDGKNGRLLKNQEVDAFASAIAWVEGLSKKQRRQMKQKARDTAEEFKTDACVEKALDFYDERFREYQADALGDLNGWSALLKSLECEYDIWANRLTALAETIAPEEMQAEEK